MSMSPITMTSEIEHTTTRPWLPWVICFIASLFFFYEFIQMNMFNAISSELMQALNLNATALGHLAAIYFYSNIIFLLPAGTILDRFSTRKVMLTALIICVIGTFCFANATNVWFAGVCRFFTGIGSAFCFLGCIRLASRWFPAQKMALVSGLIVTMAMTGGMVAQAPLTFLVAKMGWREALMLDAAFGVIITVLIAAIVRDFPANYKQKHQAQREELRQIGYWRSMRLAYFRGQNWLCGIYTSLLNLPIWILGGFLGNLYLSTTHGIPTIQASYISSMLFLGTVIGSPIMGWLSDRIGRRKLPMIIGAIVSLVLMLAIMHVPNLNFLSLLILFLALGFTTSTQVISYPSVAESNSRLITATAISVISISAIGGGAVFDPFFGKLLDIHAGPLIQAGHYSAADFQFAIWLLPITFIIGLFAAFLIKETYCREQQ